VNSPGRYRAEPESRPEVRRDEGRADEVLQAVWAFAAASGSVAVWWLRHQPAQAAAAVAVIALCAAAFATYVLGRI
jgi:hypothetical protein